MLRDNYNECPLYINMGVLEVHTPYTGVRNEPQEPRLQLVEEMWRGSEAVITISHLPYAVHHSLVICRPH